MNFQLKYIYFVLLALLCDAFSSYIFKISIWRQVITISAGIIIIYHAVKYKKNISTKFLSIFTLLLCYFIWRCLLTYASLGFSPMRMIYYTWMIFWPLPFFFLPLVVHSYHKTLTPMFLSLSLIGGLFGLGLIIDGLSGGFFTKSYVIPIGYASGELNLNEALNRLSFLAIHLTTSGIFLCLSLVASLYMHFKTTKLFYLILCILMIIGSLYTGSRQITIPLCLTFLIGFSSGLIKNKQTPIKSLLLGILIILSLYQALSFTSSQMSDATVERYTVSNIKEDNRSRHWKRGFEEIILEPDVLIWGKGVSYASAIKGKQNEIAGSHYENTFYANISSCGLANLFIILFPVVYIAISIKNKKRKLSFLDLLAIIFIFDYILISYISPNGVHLAAASAAILAGCYLIPENETKLG